MRKNNRLTKLETAAGGGGPGDVDIVVSWSKDDDITAAYIVDGVKSEVEFRRRYPDWKPGQVDVEVNWY